MAVPASLQVRGPSAATLPPAQAVNWFNFSFFGPDVQLVGGYLDVHDLANAVAGVAKASLQAEGVVRLAMSVQTFALLHQQVNAIEALMKQRGIDVSTLASMYNTAAVQAK